MECRVAYPYYLEFQSAWTSHFTCFLAIVKSSIPT